MVAATSIEDAVIERARRRSAVLRIAPRRAAIDSLIHETLTILLRALSATFLLMPGCVTADPQPPPARLTTLLANVEAVRQQHRIAAVGLALIHADGSRWTGGLGTLSHESDRPMTADTLIRVGSITKAFTGLAVLKLIEQGKLGADDPIRRWVSPALYENPWAETRPITVAQLLEHTAGFRDMTPAEFGYVNDPTAPLGATLHRFRNTHRAHWRPGLHASYSNLGAAFAGYIIEQAVGDAYESVVDATVFESLGMRDSGFFLDARDQASLAAGYDTDGTTPIPYWHMAYRAFGGANSTVNDMTGFVAMLLKQGRHGDRQVFRAESIRRMETPATTLAARKGLTFGDGFGNYQWLRGRALFHGHGGDADGYLSRYGYTRDHSSGYFVVINAFNSRALGRIRKLVESYLIADADADAGAQTEPRRLPLQPDLLRRIAGDYVSVTSRFGQPGTQRMRISRSGERLYLHADSGAEQELIPVTREQFRLQGQPVATIIIAEADDGRLYFQDSDDNFVRVR